MGSGLADIVSSATYDATCTNVVKCNKPNTTTDPRNNVTDLVYDATHGGVTSITRPAPTAGAVRPQTRYSYTQVQGATNPALYPSVYMLTKVSACQKLASCDNAADETRTTAVYNSNLLPTTVASGDGSGTLTATSTLTYDPRGNLLTIDGPLTGTADTTRFVYDSIDRAIGTISPDPDGAGVLKNRAVRTTFRPDGQVDKAERGTTNGQTDAAFAAFVSLETQQLGYDSNNRPVTQSLVAGGTTHALSQLSYDAAGRPECSTVRMNPAVFGSPPASACTLGTQGTNGPDRITKTIYDAAGQVTQQRVAVGTADEAAEATGTYTGNGKLATFTDAENNKTTYEYDGHDRLSKARMPLPNKGANASSTTDYELLGYDAASNVTSRRLRDATSIASTYDNLGRLTLADLPGSDPDVTYGYDNLGRIESATQTGNALSFTYDALGRNLTQGGSQGTVTSTWDLAGRRTRLTYPGTGLYVDQDYLVTGETSKLRENGAVSGVGVLATYAYDDLGRRVSRTFGNGVVQAYTYDPISRLQSLTNDLANIANDQSISFAHGPAGQITSATRTGDAYAWTGSANVNRGHAANGLNQYTQAGPVAFTYDDNGNLKTSGTDTFGYDHVNRLLTATTAAGSATLHYDPLGRLSRTIGAADTRFAYDSVNLVAEYGGSGNLLKRYVHGPGTDEPIVWYEGAGTADRRFLSSDERGSVSSVTNGSGTLLGINTYDEYGIPGAANLGRFQYTGQTWLPELGMYYYKARIYSPTLGRFLQTDPIGIEGGINLYGYVGNDPVNKVDPLGLQDQIIDVVGTRPTNDDRGGPVGSAAGGFEWQVFGNGRYLHEEPTEQSNDVLVIGVNCTFHPEDRRCSGRPIPAPPPLLRPGPPIRQKPSYNPATNYCGGTGSAQLPNSVGGASINDLCYRHDNCYTSSGISRSLCDARFGAAVHARVSIFGLNLDPAQRLGVGAIAGALSYAIVRAGGGDFYVP